MKSLENILCWLVAMLIAVAMCLIWLSDVLAALWAMAGAVVLGKKSAGWREIR